MWRTALGGCLKKDGPICHVAPGGKFCWAAWSGDSAPALLTLDAEIEIAGASGTRRMPLREFYKKDGMDRIALRARRDFDCHPRAARMAGRRRRLITSCACAIRSIIRSRASRWRWMWTRAEFAAMRESRSRRQSRARARSPGGRMARGAEAEQRN